MVAAEIVGWSVLGGRVTVTEAGPPLTSTIESAAGVAIVNAKVGARLGIGEMSDLYIGYGRALTDETWYDNIVRVEFRRNF